MRKAVDRVYGHRVMRRRSNEVTSEAALRGARGSAALAGADWALEEVRRRTDFSGDPEARMVGAALRLTAEAGQLLSVWRQSPLRVLARLHLVASGNATEEVTVGRPRLVGEAVDEPFIQAPLPSADEVAGRLDGLARLIISGSSAPALVIAAVVHGELLALRPFSSHNGLVARAAERIVLIGSGLDPKAICPAEVGHAEQGQAAYSAAFEGYLSGTPEGMSDWFAHCGRAVELGARESTAVCEALQRGRPEPVAVFPGVGASGAARSCPARCVTRPRESSPRSPALEESPACDVMRLCGWRMLCGLGIALGGKGLRGAPARAAKWAWLPVSGRWCARRSRAEGVSTWLRRYRYPAPPLACPPSYQASSKMCPSGRELLPVTWCGWPVFDGSTSRGCSVFMLRSVGP